VRLGYGHHWQWNWKQGEDQYNGLGVYLGVALEVDVIKKDPYQDLPSSLQIPVSLLVIGSVSIGGTRK
jgi:hypothetical protein